MRNLFLLSLIALGLFNCKVKKTPPDDLIIGNWFEVEPCQKIVCDTLIINKEFFNSNFFSSYFYTLTTDTITFLTPNGAQVKYNYYFSNDNILVIENFDCNLIGECESITFKKYTL